MKTLIFLLALWPMLLSAQSYVPETENDQKWNWAQKMEATGDSFLAESQEMIEKISPYEKEVYALIAAILAGYLFLCFIMSASDKIERLMIFNRIPVIIINTTIGITAIMFISGNNPLTSNLVVALVGILSFVIVGIALFSFRRSQWGVKTAIYAGLTMLIPANVMMGVITSSWLAFLISFLALFIIALVYFIIWGIVLRIRLKIKIKKGGDYYGEE